MTRDDLIRRIRLGEDSTLEFKTVHLAGGHVKAPARGDFADELGAMANGWGGTMGARRGRQDPRHPRHSP